ncbi:alpha-amylase [Terriglobus albidus]|uniref:Alpha-amylase n=1 Tax=Terriglobus albidus TaxID=1592106 RepID=A0A5B9EJD9_9BACT|nr:alpha-amylase [Terriglobus albidus]
MLEAEVNWKIHAWVAGIVWCAAATWAQDAPKIEKIDPPNWWVNMPKAMLLVKGENLSHATFTLSDAHLRIAQVKSSPNGHWAELWLNASPQKAEEVTISARNTAGKGSATYKFLTRRSTTDGFAGFSSKDVMYLIMTDRFADGDVSNDTVGNREKIRGWHGGDLRGVMQHLDYLQELGITTLWLTPVYQNHEADSYHGYGGTDMYAVDEHYGSMDDLKELSAALHQRGMKLVLDTVPNHVGPKHPWVEDEPEPDWFHGNRAKHSVAQGDFKPLTDPHASWRDQKNVTEGWFADILPDMNQENSAVAQYLTQNAVWWTEMTGADGLRIDTFPYVGRSFWQGFHAQLHGLYPKLTTVGEVFNPDATIVSSFAGGVTRNSLDTGLDTPFDFPSYFALRDVFVKGEPMTKLAETLRMDALYPHPERLTPFLGNHDTTRFLWEKGATLPRLKLAFAVLLTMRGMPQIYSGDEIAMTGGEDPDNRRDFPGGWAGDPQNAFTSGGRSTQQAEMYDWVRELAILRSRCDELQRGEEQVLLADKDTMVYVRGDALNLAANGKRRVIVAINRSQESRSIQLATSDTSLAGGKTIEMLLGSGTIDSSAEYLELKLLGESVTVFSIH